MTGIILAGGKNTRMGTDKAFLEIDNERLIDRIVRIFREIFQEVILVTNSPLAYLDQDVEIVTDIFKDKGALGGIYTGLFYASYGHAFVSACDMPFLKRNFIEYMMEHIGSYDIVAPDPADGLQPLHAIYAKSCLSSIKKLITMDKLKITGFYRGLKIFRISKDIIKSFDPEGRMFFNVNAKEDLKLISRSLSCLA
ncbi:MAG: molybdenum cofactor guanylyltransferase [Syntrophales bacterium]|nr:molybdenum cofactor guanylyltransferase [Syntrophales bacterium]